MEHVPRVLPKNDDPSLVSRNKRMLGQLLGTLEVGPFRTFLNGSVPVPSSSRPIPACY